MASLSRIEPPEKGIDVRDLRPFIAKLCVPVNALISNITVLQGTEANGKLEISEGNAILTLPKASGGDGSGGGLGPAVFIGSASGQVGYFLVNSDGMFYSTPPTKADGTAYPLANPY